MGGRGPKSILHALVMPFLYHIPTRNCEFIALVKMKSSSALMCQGPRASHQQQAEKTFWIYLYHSCVWITNTKTMKITTNAKTCLTSRKTSRKTENICVCITVVFESQSWWWWSSSSSPLWYIYENTLKGIELLISYFVVSAQSFWTFCSINYLKLKRKYPIKYVHSPIINPQNCIFSSTSNLHFTKFRLHISNIFEIFWKFCQVGFCWYFPLPISITT